MNVWALDQCGASRGCMERRACFLWLDDTACGGDCVTEGLRGTIDYSFGREKASNGGGSCIVMARS